MNTGCRWASSRWCTCRRPSTPAACTSARGCRRLTWRTAFCATCSGARIPTKSSSTRSRRSSRPRTTRASSRAPSRPGSPTASSTPSCAPIWRPHAIPCRRRSRSPTSWRRPTKACAIRARRRCSSTTAGVWSPSDFSRSPSGRWRRRTRRPTSSGATHRRGPPRSLHGHPSRWQPPRWRSFGASRSTRRARNWSAPARVQPERDRRLLDRLNRRAVHAASLDVATPAHASAPRGQVFRPQRNTPAGRAPVRYVSPIKRASRATPAHGEASAAATAGPASTVSPASRRAQARYSAIRTRSATTFSRSQMRAAPSR